MTFPVTLAAFVFSLAFAALCLWRGLGEPKLGRVRMIPWTPLGLLGVVTALMLLTHMVNLVGIETGGRFR